MVSYKNDTDGKYKEGIIDNINKTLENKNLEPSLRMALESKLKVLSGKGYQERMVMLKK